VVVASARWTAIHTVINVDARAASVRPDVACNRVAARQHGVITASQANECGVDADGIFRRTKAGLWQRILPQVYRVGQGVSEWHQRLCALTKWSEGVASHRAAALLLELEGFDKPVLEITSDRRLRPVSNTAIVHYVSQLPRDSSVVAGIGCTSPTRTLVDLAGVAAAELVELATEDALRRGLTSLARLRWFLSVEGARGRRGAKALRTIVQRFEEHQTWTQTEFESRLRQLLRAAGLPLPIAQHQIWHEGKQVARADLAYPHARLAIEAVSYRWHSGRSAWARDQKRSNRLAVRGWRVLNITWDDLMHRPDEVVRRIAEALGHASLFDDSPG
jgi:very-short-patch-repair endonuclease